MPSLIKVLPSRSRHSGGRLCHQLSLILCVFFFLLKANAYCRLSLHLRVPDSMTLTRQAQPKAQAVSKRLARKTRRADVLKKSNERLEARRAALRVFNALLDEVGADALQMDTYNKPPEQALDRALRVLDARCSEAEHRDRFANAVRQWVNNAGLLPQGVRLKDTDVLEILQDEGEIAPTLPKHRLLLRSYGSTGLFCAEGCCAMSAIVKRVLGGAGLASAPDCIWLGRPSPSLLFANPLLFRIQLFIRLGQTPHFEQPDTSFLLAKPSSKSYT